MTSPHPLAGCERESPPLFSSTRWIARLALARSLVARQSVRSTSGAFAVTLTAWTTQLTRLSRIQRPPARPESARSALSQLPTSQLAPNKAMVAAPETQHSANPAAAPAAAVHTQQHAGEGVNKLGQGQVNGAEQGEQQGKQGQSEGACILSVGRLSGSCGLQGLLRSEIKRVHLRTEETQLFPWPTRACGKRMDGSHGLNKATGRVCMRVRAGGPRSEVPASWAHQVRAGREGDCDERIRAPRYRLERVVGVSGLWLRRT